MATAKITKLTDDQERRLVEFREEWRQVGLCCDPADFATGDEVIRGFYSRLGKPAPLILHFSSPLMCELAVNVVISVAKEKPQKLGGQLRGQHRGQLRDQLWDQLGGQLRGQLWDQLGDQLRGQLWDQLGGQLRDQLGGQLRGQLGGQLGGQLRDQLGGQLWDQLGDQLWDQLGDQLWDQIRGQLRDQLGDQLWDQIRDQLREMRFSNNAFLGQMECAWQAFYLFGHEIGVRYKAEDIALLLEWGRLSKSVGWWAPWEGICFVSDRPRKALFDNEHRLHSERGKAVEYADGWGVSAWHGTRVPDEWLVEKSDLSAKTALTWQNIEQRRAAIEIVGWSKILRELDARVIDADGDPQIGTLVEVKLPDLTQPARFLRVTCGTGREFAISVHPSCQTAIEAQSWCVGLEAKDFQIPEVRT